jgi:hypothetical protein
MTALHLDQQFRAPNSSHLAGRNLDADSVPNRRREPNICEGDGRALLVLLLLLMVVPRGRACHLGFEERCARETKGEDAAGEEGGHGWDGGSCSLLGGVSDLCKWPKENEGAEDEGAEDKGYLLTDQSRGPNHSGHRARGHRLFGASWPTRYSRARCRSRRNRERRSRGHKLAGGLRQERKERRNGEPAQRKEDETPQLVSPSTSRTMRAPAELTTLIAVRKRSLAPCDADETDCCCARTKILQPRYASVAAARRAMYPRSESDERRQTTGRGDEFGLTVVVGRATSRWDRMCERRAEADASSR